MNARHLASPFPIARPVRLPASVLRVNKPAAAPSSDAAARVGATLRGLRLVGGVSGQELAHRAGLSRSLLSRLERGSCRPRSTRWKAWLPRRGAGRAIAAGAGATRDLCRVLVGQGIRVDQEAGEGCRCELLGHQVPDVLAFESCLVVQQPRVKREATSQSGIRFFYVLSGHGICAHGSREVPVQPGDALLFGAKVPHSMQTTQGMAVAILSVLFALRG